MPDEQLPRIDITPHWATVQRDIVRIVDLVPDDKIDWSPKPELWNFRGILIHVSDARDNWMSRDVQGRRALPQYLDHRAVEGRPQTRTRADLESPRPLPRQSVANRQDVHGRVQRRAGL